MFAVLLLISGSERTNNGVFLRRQSIYGNADQANLRNLKILHSVAFLSSGIIISTSYNFLLTIMNIFTEVSPP